MGVQLLEMHHGVAAAFMRALVVDVLDNCGGEKGNCIGHGDPADRAGVALALRAGGVAVATDGERAGGGNLVAHRALHPTAKSLVLLFSFLNQPFPSFRSHTFSLAGLCNKRLCFNAIQEEVN